ncbi:hypothetical protein M5K25_021419 [Dendrobium thyrsiflorum]|uniref:Uncharacterized protein n=1 Tax=Dendrobium thyrsiflorum TaxID=117978 RepID=A0ABD0UCC9_DENTH
MRIIEEKKSESSISDTQASSEDKQIDKGKDVNKEGKEINLQSQADGDDKEIYSIKLPGAAKIGEGFYINSMMVVIIVHIFLYGKPYLSLSGLESAIMKQALMRGNNPLKAAMASQYVIQLGLLMVLPMVMEIGLKGDSELHWAT